MSIKKNLRKAPYFLFVFVFFISSCFLQVVAAEEFNKQKIITSYLFNFAKNIEWPNEAAMASFNIGLVDSDDPLLFTELNSLTAKATIRNLPIAVNRVSASKLLANTAPQQYQIIFIAQVNSKIIPELNAALAGKPVLIVSWDYSNKQMVMINLTTLANARIGFEINKSNVINQNLRPLPELILIGGTEIDVAKLYREGQATLQEMQKQLQSREKTLYELSENIQAQQVQNRRLEEQMTTLNLGIKKSDALIASQLLQMKSQHDQIEKNKNDRLVLLKEVELRSNELVEQRDNLQRITAQIELKEKRLALLDTTIKKQEAELLLQKNAIVGLDKTVSTQKVALRYSWRLVILGLLFIVTILIAYVVKRRDNQRLAVRTQDLLIAQERLAIAKRKAEDANQAKSEFLSLMSHELRTPLQAIIGYTEVMIEDLKIEDDQRHIDDLNRVISNSERLLKLINSVLDLAKIEAGKMELDLIEAKLSGLVAEAVNSVKPLLDKNGIQLHVDVNDGSFLPVLDPEKIIHILINLLGNACKFSAMGVVKIKAYHEEKRIFISVADTGIGLTEAQKLQIFEPFKQADSSTTRKYQGSGLGLSISRQLCEIMGGTLNVDSQLGKGATFMVVLPLPIKPAGNRISP
jgi:signal transduction histidine kinase